MYLAEDLVTPGGRIEEAADLLSSADVVVADITGHKPDTYFAVALAYLAGKSSAVLVAEELSTLGYQVSSWPVISYGGKDLAIFRADLRLAIETALEKGNPGYDIEFSDLAETLTGLGQQPVIIALLAVAKSPTKIQADSSFYYEGHTSKNRYVSHTESARTALSFFLGKGYADVKDGRIILTGKGKAFCDFLERAGYVVDMVNGQGLVEGYMPFLSVWLGRRMTARAG